MTLQEWATRHGQLVHQHPSGASYVIRDLIPTREAERELWRLSNYKVSTAGPVIWLVG